LRCRATACRPRARARRRSARAPARASTPRPPTAQSSRRWLYVPSTRESSFVLLCQRGQLVAYGPELGIELLVDQPAEQLDRCALSADDLSADDPLHDLEVADAPQRRPLVELGQRLRELVQVLELAPAPVELRQAEARLAAQMVERLSEIGRDAPQVGPARRVEAAAVAQHRPDRRRVLPG